jgi:hypothetical protein
MRLRSREGVRGFLPHRREVGAEPEDLLPVGVVEGRAISLTLAFVVVLGLGEGAERNAITSGRSLCARRGPGFWGTRAASPPRARAVWA